MATTMTMTVATPTAVTQDCCPQCGFKVVLLPADDTQAALAAAQKQIADLEAQVRLLNEKASAAVDRCADYEDELAKLRSELEASRSHNGNQMTSPTASTAPTASTPGPTPLHTPSASIVASPSPARSSFLSSSAASRISALLSPRKSTPNLRSPPQQQQQPPPLPPARYNNSLPLHSSSNPLFSPSAAAGTPSSPAPSTEDLLEALTREQTLRREAEGRLSDTSREVEELSVSLFEQANEMVATERRVRARLEERIETLERRDAEKRRRLDRLESAVDRIERVRSLLGQQGRETTPAVGIGAGAGNRSTL